MKEAHRKAITYALECGDMISFDPNIRLPLWKGYNELRKAILEFIPYAHVLKISDEELEFITGKTKVEDAKDVLFQGNVQLVIYTKGADGAEAYTKTASAEAPSRKVKAIDTTGAGDTFCGCFLACLQLGRPLEACLHAAAAAAAIAVSRPGASASIPTMDEVTAFLRA